MVINGRGVVDDDDDDSVLDRITKTNWKELLLV